MYGSKWLAREKVCTKGTNKPKNFKWMPLILSLSRVRKPIHARFCTMIVFQHAIRKDNETSQQFLFFYVTNQEVMWPHSQNKVGVQVSHGWQVSTNQAIDNILGGKHSRAKFVQCVVHKARVGAKTSCSSLSKTRISHPCTLSLLCK